MQSMHLLGQTNWGNIWKCTLKKSPKIQKRNYELCSVRGDIWKRPFINKTLPEAQRAQGIESITWINLSARVILNFYQSEKLQTQYPGFLNGSQLKNSFCRYQNWRKQCGNVHALSLYFITHPDKIETLWNKEYFAPLASLVNFHMEEEGGRGGVDILKFVWNPEIWSKSWNLVENSEIWLRF